jgi:transcriptional regulator with XRE-family HTH domain
MRLRSHHTPAYRRMCLLLRSQRERAGLTIRSLAAKLEKPHSFVTKVEQGERRIDPIEFIDWCNACGVDPRKAISRLVKG